MRACISGNFIVAQIDYCRARRIVDAGDSLESVARWRANGTIFRRLRVEGNDPNRLASHRRVQAEVSKVIEVYGQGQRTPRRRRQLRVPAAASGKAGERDECQNN